jgi:hypothetical protein
MIYQSTTSATANTWTRAFVLPVTGTASIAGTTTVTGTGTAFLTAFIVGDEIVINNEKRRVVAIASDTSITVDVAFNTTIAGATIGIFASRYSLQGGNKIFNFYSAFSNASDIVLAESKNGTTSDISLTVASMRVVAGQSISPIVSPDLFNIFVQSATASQVFFCQINQ